MRAQASLSRSAYSCVFDAQAREGYPGCFSVRIGEDGHMFYIADENGDEERGSQTPPPEVENRCDYIFVVPFRMVSLS